MPYTKSDAYCDFCMDFVESKSQMQKFIKAKIEKLDRAIKFVND